MTGEAARHFEVTLTAPSAEEASRLGRLAVEGRLAACAQVSGPVASTYWWEGAVASADEWVCTLKTSAAALPHLVAALRAAHPYDTPEIVATAIESGDPDYLAWVDEETSQRS